MQKEKGSVAVIIVLTLIVILAIGIGFFFLMKSPSNNASSTTNGKGDLSQTSLKGDINRDGAVDAEDADLIRKASPCNHVDPCWNKVVGKTKDGDNPIYASDLDLNHDDNINELDTSAMSTE
ncbi:hypothetical protein A2334_03355 [Candidatus Roizmanbacteria bacterium RIFOXYB2_FULL_38_10]|uniref:Dockerin domain-containing protein n=1 Tax=Candidatus Roizmanbacteria bacterium RIFOXYD1_FULL_38_12 TaxID=1802093 RepID=A0A1F7L150_9BACT|nr:MAG: hypothetical protein A3K47_03490 [Candidatus Roizmanbacteria bacterium RIFOXYA2_FULL_38_14]OGK63826.1 MAG: hypothetical protein A3K27_03490 [Candidatus Roizmanbacteria bacterium RIFOXYA1_FULL_37_12]OGK65672.1 MAG: hypothetical protein A3K38_03490 [Candidatus Roizmanbacteria bacterium RIFOXYB1_FULL_40_23]OGK67440.1 MAG: hypothetical protein A2334_03355 [Candidatus Roizmanbacteria bacterium RIFOXYB2_FULL_38_10]OGK70077.1 MAG: hypothetical protein A3K21_03495 [Candidatus Roizmanbacteria ba